MEKYSSIDEYITTFPAEVRVLLEEMRMTIRKAAPEAKECIAYGIPTFTLQGNLVHFGGYKNHIGFYPGPSGLRPFKEELSGYKGARGTVQFPLDKPLPLELVSRIVKLRVQENLDKARAKKSSKSLANKQGDGFWSELSVPARRALENKGISSLEQLSGFSEAEVLKFHGMGPASLPKLRQALEYGGLQFRETET